MSGFTVVCQALSVEARVKILRLLKAHRLCVNAITCRLGITQSAVSQHLRVLKSAGLVKAKKRGYWMHYSINTKALLNHRRMLNKTLIYGK
ncbi:MAG: winged helix-turn-helix transcriptional regulator [Planctomycetes bacterium]|nr:winged helix-turn-helix transcriptional regulator [Planctomycetota bacterium]